MAFTTINKGPVQSPVNQNVFFDLNPIDVTKIQKRPTWISSTISVKVDQAEDGLTCTFVPNSGFAGRADCICDIWYNDGNQERYWWQVTWAGNMNPTVMSIPK